MNVHDFISYRMEKTAASKSQLAIANRQYKEGFLAKKKLKDFSARFLSPEQKAKLKASAKEYPLGVAVSSRHDYGRNAAFHYGKGDKKVGDLLKRFGKEEALKAKQLRKSLLNKKK